MQISIIIPFHRGLHFLEDCLDSLKEQTKKDFEILLINDHTEEDLYSLLSSYQGEIQIRVLDLEDGTGVAAARNLGIEHAQGEYLYFLDSDDYLGKETLELLCDVLDHSNYSFVYGPMEYTWFNRHVFHETESGEVLQQKYIGDAVEDLLSGRLELGYLSVLNILIRKSEIFNIKFNKTLKLYSDIPVLMRILNSSNITFCETAFYIKRLHNDEILYPSLSGGKFDDRYEELIAAYQDIEDLDQNIKKEFDIKLLQGCQENFLREFRQEEVSIWEDSRFLGFHTYMKNVNSKIYKEKKYKKICYAFQNDRYSKAKRKINMMLAKEKLKRMLSDQRFFNRTINKYIFEKFSQKDNWVVFESFLGKNYSDSPKYIYQYILNHKRDYYQCIWILNDTSIKIPGNPIKVKRFSLKYFYYMTRAKYWVNNMRQPIWYAKRKSQVMLQTWHGTPLKKLVFDMDDVYSASPTYKRQVYSQSRFWDYLISDNPFSTKVFQSCFLFNKEKILETGYPRNDILYAEDRDQISENIKEELGIPQNKKVILYAPTWRDDEFYEQGQYKFKLKLDLKFLRQNIGEEYVILLRTHYFIADAIDVTRMEDFVFNVSKYDDIAELYLISDICITDYSSVFFDYANLRRPILFFTYDFEKYRDVLRGFYIDMEKDIPGPLLFTNEEIVEAVKDIEGIQEKFKEQYEKFYNRFCCFDDGHASERVIEQVFNR